MSCCGGNCGCGSGCGRGSGCGGCKQHDDLGVEGSMNTFFGAERQTGSSSFEGFEMAAGSESGGCKCSSCKCAGSACSCPCCGCN